MALEITPNLRRFVVEFGLGIDQHGQNPTGAACKAVKDAIYKSCLAGLIEIVRMKDVNDMVVDIQVACPYPDKVDQQVVLAAIPFGRKEVTIETGGMITHGLFQPELGDRTDEALIATAAITVWADVDKMLDAWRTERV